MFARIVICVTGITVVLGSAGILTRVTALVALAAGKITMSANKRETLMSEAGRQPRIVSMALHAVLRKVRVLLAVIIHVACIAVIVGCPRILARIARCVARVTRKRVVDRARNVKVQVLCCSQPCIILMTLRAVLRQ
jgi:cytochrome bd-type quinol oxidase subunit 1